MKDEQREREGGADIRPADGSTVEDLICCPLDPSTLNTSIILGTDLHISKKNDQAQF